MRRKAPRTLALILVGTGFLFTQTGCQSTEHRISGTDIPKIPELTLVHSETEGERSRVRSAEFRFDGPVFDALERIRWTSTGFEKDGWTLDSITGNAAEAEAIFSMPWHEPGMRRVADLHVIASQVRGKATLLVRVEKAPEEAKEPASGE